ncbi:restriction endonuclease subunit S [Pseudomonas jessenii]|uniref:Type I restriction enzyme S subunit n=1 Tax=Pseudomonas jessenii TaxID=77298 RepID=A0A370SR53_PSEJE|nr:restriction endonuclease subunit S [Pseudomonas jessenii]RDL22171.1 type I restriction enzyme S subunit [Pseudomonas jessenii]
MTFSKYSGYKNSGVKWLSDVPEHWDVRRNKQAFRIVSTLVGSKSKDFQLLSLTLRGVIPRDVESGKGKFPAEFDTYQTVEPDDIVFCLFDIDETPRTVGISSDYGMITGAYTVVRAFAGADPRFIYYYYFSVDLRKGLRPFYTGLRKVVRPETFMNIELPLPPMSEQANICDFLDHETARIDALIEEQQRLIELLKEKRQAVISQAVTKGLDPTVTMKDSGMEWLGEVPAHWVCKSYRYASVIYRGKFSHRPRNDPSLYGGEFAFIQTGDIARADKYIRDYKQSLNEKGVAVSQKFPAETLVMAIAANVGDTAILGFEAYAPDSVVGFKPEKGIELEFLRFSLIAALQELKKTSTQSTQANLNIDRISGIQSVFPPLTEQVEISDYLNGLMERFSLLEQQAVASIELMNERRSALISAAVTGKIDVRGWQLPARAQATAVEVEEAV